MKYQIIGKNIEVTKGIEEALIKKLSKMDKYFVINDDVDCRAVVRTYKTGQKVEVTITTPMMTFRAEVTDADLYAAFDLAIDKLEGQMRKLKTRLDRTKRQGLGRDILLENVVADEEDEAQDEVVKTKSLKSFGSLHLLPICILQISCFSLTDKNNFSTPSNIGIVLMALTVFGVVIFNIFSPFS